ncbi:MAG: hypothetical protein AAGB24_00740 [Bacteroidota bacterium]
MQLPYRQIPDYPSDYGAGNIIVRMIDGLGYRYYWATEGLTQKDLEYMPSKDGRTTLETLQHIYGMSETIRNAPRAKPNIRPKDFSHYTFGELRSKTLNNLKMASTLLKGKQSEDFEDFKVVFDRGERQFDFPFWNLINGMLSDCLYHTGQVVAFRRATGNAMNPNVNVFLGKTKE